MKNLKLDKLKLDLSLKAKNGIDFIFAACIIWIAIAVIWTLSYTAYTKSIFTFIIGGPLLPIAFLFSKIFKTQWKIKENPLQPLGLWLNFAQLFYFPFLILILLTLPEYFVVTYAIITGAHLFPYAWFYNERSYAFVAGFISVGSLIMGLNQESNTMFYVPLYTAFALLILGMLIYKSYLKKNKTHQ